MLKVRTVTTILRIIGYWKGAQSGCFSECQVQFGKEKKKAGQGEEMFSVECGVLALPLGFKSVNQPHPVVKCGYACQCLKEGDDRPLLGASLCQPILEVG